MTEPQLATATAEIRHPGREVPVVPQRDAGRPARRAGRDLGRGVDERPVPAVEHRGVDTRRLVAVTGDHLRADEMSSAVHDMGPGRTETRRARLPVPRDYTGRATRPGVSS